MAKASNVKNETCLLTFIVGKKLHKKLQRLNKYSALKQALI